MFALKYESYARPLVLLCYDESKDEMPPWPFAWPSAGVAIAGEMALMSFRRGGCFSRVVCRGSSSIPQPRDQKDAELFP
eukprot:scaffold11205_cov191-Skeletonema_marinoi.AAC.4